MKLTIDEFKSPVGPLRLWASERALVRLEFIGRAHERPIPDAAARGRGPISQRARVQLADYFAGRRSRFDLPLAPEGTEFQREVWAALQQIGPGETWTYGQLARALGRPRHSRAVGAANGRNPISIIVPCHRVIGADGRLTGYAGGLAAKDWLLRHESARARPRAESSLDYGAPLATQSR